MAQTVKVLHLRFGAENLGKTKAPAERIRGAFESLTSALAVIFFNSSRAFKGITTT
jgi:hypothetical protein